MVAAFLEILDTLISVEAINTLAVLIILLISVISMYLTRIRGATIKAIEVQKQTPMSSSFHTIIFTNYGNKTGVVLGPKLVSTDEKMRITQTDNDNGVIPVEAQGTVVSEIEVYSGADANTEYHLEYTDQAGKVIKLPKRIFQGKATNQIS